MNKERRAQSVLEGLRSDDDEAARRAVLELAREVLAFGGEQQVWWPPLVGALAADGWEFDPSSQQLLPTVDGLEVAQERGLLEQGLVDRGLDVAASHYRQAGEAFSSGNWESANAQARSFLEALIPTATAELIGAHPRKDPAAALQDLKTQGVLLDGEFDFARGLWRLCHARGSHAGKSDSDEARFRFLAVTAYGRFLLSRLQA